MHTGVKQRDEAVQVKRYKVQHSVDEYTFPVEAYIHAVKIDGKYIHVELTDQRVLSIPLWWIPTVYNASTEDREKFEISRSRTMIVWDPARCGINDEIRIADYLGPLRDGAETAYTPRAPRKQVSEAKARSRK